MELLHLLKVRLRFSRPTRLHFFHGPALYAMILDRMGNPADFPPGIALYAPEKGRVAYSAGEPYHFGLAMSPSSFVSSLEMARLISSPPRTAFGQTGNAPFGDNFVVEEILDIVTDKSLSGKAAALTLEALSPVADALAKERDIVIRFISPLLILRTPTATKEYIMDERVFEPDKFLGMAQKSFAEWWPNLAEGCKSEPPACKLSENLLARADVSYPKKRLLGSAGSVKLSFENKVGAMALPLLLAGAVGAGKGRNMGQGRFVIEGFPLCPSWPPMPARTILCRAADPENLTLAMTELAKAGPAPGVDAISKDEFLDRLTSRMPILRARLERAEVCPMPLRGIFIREKNTETGVEKIRPLAIPVFDDRFLQRAVYQELEDAASELFEDSSFAYRKGLSVRRARESVSAARKDGFCHVLDADIKSYFDTVDWNRLQIRLEALLGPDPVTAVLMDWVKAPVEVEGQTIARTCGLPQGAVISPLLANIFLDALDEAVALEGFRLVRYADDFVVMAKSKDDLVRARKVVTEELSRLGLSLNQDKTKETTFDTGFTFLGSLFCRSVVLCPDEKTKEVLEVGENLPHDALARGEIAAPSGWVADYLAMLGKGLPEDPEAVRPGFRPALPAPSPDRRAVYVVSNAAKLIGKKRGLLIEKADEPPVMVSWDQISELVVLGGRYVSSSVIQRAMRNRIPISFHRWDGTPVGMVLPDRVRSPSMLSLMQWAWSADDTVRLKMARSLIHAKIRNFRLMVRRRSEAANLLSSLANLSEEADRAPDAAVLRGIEGRAAHEYFICFGKFLKTGISPPFPGRVTRGAEDPVNAMLNLLYSQLFRLAHTTILTVGLDPWLGVFHEGRGRYAALAADMMEPFRFLADRVVLEAVNHARVRQADFISSEKGPYKMVISTQAVKLLIGRFEDLLAAKVTDARNQEDTYRGHLHRQTASFARLVQKTEIRFHPFLMKW